MKKIWALLLSVAVFLTVLYYHQWQHWLAYATGSYNVPGVAHNYNAFSGSLSDVGEYAIITSVLSSAALVWRSNTCHATWWCWRHGHFHLEGTPYKLCARHHPHDIPTVREEIKMANGGSHAQS